MVVSVPKLWPGSTIVCIGGGPSLTREDVDVVRDKARVIAINNAYTLAPWADVLYACDWSWHRAHSKGVAEFQGLKYTITAHVKPEKREKGWQMLRHTGIEGLELDPTALRTGRNSGYQAIGLAVHLGAKRIVLLGYDMQLGPKGETHWHGRHAHMPSNPPFKNFLKAFPSLVAPLAQIGVSVVNCSRRTALDCFPKARLEDVFPMEQEQVA